MTGRHRQLVAWMLLSGCWLGCASGAMGAEPGEVAEPKDAQQLEFFEAEIRPLLAEHCYDCHSQRAEKVKGGLLLDSGPAVLQGGDSGPAVVPGDPAASMLMSAVRYEGLEMPPDQRLSDAQVAQLETWIRMGAPFPAAHAAPAGSATARRTTGMQVTDEHRAYWAYQPVRRPPIPHVTDDPWSEHPIDALVADRLVREGLSHNGPAEPRQLVRRLYFDLIGIPPDAETIAEFCRDPSPRAWQLMVDRLLASPLYGERWGQHWLDLVRFAQTNGYERDGEKPQVWRYRDYVIRSFNQDKPYDRFVKEQLAGDELPDGDADGVIATGFYHLGVWDDEPDDARAAEYDGLDDMLSTIGQVFLAQTLGCARCHDHMFDPIPQTDYYALLACIRNVRQFENARYDLESGSYLPLAPVRDVAGLLTRRRERLAELQKTLEQTSDAEQRKKIEEQIRQVSADNGGYQEWALAVREHGPQPKETNVLVRGNAATPGAVVTPHFLTVMSDRTVESDGSPHGLSCGLRSQMANWIASPDNPLTARVIANRVWLHHFGRGIVATPNDFGKAGLLPTHPELLDFLADELMAHNWSIKHLHRLIVTSRTYQMSSAVANPDAQLADPDNVWLWRQNVRRLDAEVIRDSMLWAAGELNLQMFGRGIFPELSSEVLAAQSRPGWGWEVSGPADRRRRSVYVFTKRGVRDPLLETFDYGNTTSSVGARPVTTVAPQALVLLNGQFSYQRSQAMARRVLQESQGDIGRAIERAYRLAYGRSPTPAEQEFARDYLSRQEVAWGQLQHVLTFRPDVPTALQEEYRRLLAAADYYVGPRVGWTYGKGQWVGGYETIDALDDDRVPFALWEGTDRIVEQISGNLLLHGGTRFASLLVDATTRGDLLDGLEVRLDPREQQIQVFRHAEQLVTLASAPAQLPTSRWIPFRVARSDQRLQLWLGEAAEPVLTVDVPAANVAGPAASGIKRFGIAVSRGAVSLDRLVARTADGELSVEPVGTDRAPVSVQAMQSFCHVLLNANEFVYVD
ncbi:MAG: PSD1 and planctomycete cytochrome C domain-containing protein [Pirellulales bacterium]